MIVVASNGYGKGDFVGKRANEKYWLWQRDNNFLDEGKEEYIRGIEGIMDQFHSRLVSQLTKNLPNLIGVYTPHSVSNPHLLVELSL